MEATEDAVPEVEEIVARNSAFEFQNFDGAISGVVLQAKKRTDGSFYYLRIVEVKWRLLGG